MPASTFHSVRFCMTVLVFAAASALFLFGQQPAPLAERIPEGWYVYPNSRLKQADEYTVRCFNYSRNEWKVSSEGDDVKISKWSDKRADIPSLPPRLKHEPWMPGRTLSAGLRTAMRFENGWLLAYDAGEFGGGMWLTHEQGSETKQILRDHVRAVVRLGGGRLLVLTGLAHMTMDFGNAFIFSNPDGLNITLQHSVHLDGAPSAYTQEVDGSVLFVTACCLHRMTQSGELQTLAYLPKWTRMQYPNSICNPS